MKTKINITEKHLAALKIIKTCKVDIWSHPKGARGGKQDEFDDLCEYCGKHTKDGEGMYFQILTNGIIIPNSIDEKIVWDLHYAGLLKQQPQGGFAIGATCAKKLLGKDVKKFNDNNTNPL